MNKKLHIQLELCTPQSEPECTVSTTFWQRHVNAIFQVEWCTSYQYYVVYSNAIPIWHITFVLHTVGLLTWLLILLLYVEMVCWLHSLVSSLSLTLLSSITAATSTDLVVFLFLLHASPACCCNIFLIQFWTSVLHSTVGPAWCTSLWSWLYCSIPSVFHGIFLCPGFMYLVLAGMMLLGMVFSPHFIYRSQAAPMVPNSSPKATTQQFPVHLTIIHSAS
jgi:hypothetical protein